MFCEVLRTYFFFGPFLFDFKTRDLSWKGPKPVVVTHA